MFSQLVHLFGDFGIPGFQFGEKSLGPGGCLGQNQQSRQQKDDPVEDGKERSDDPHDDQNPTDDSAYDPLQSFFVHLNNLFFASDSMYRGTSVGCIYRFFGGTSPTPFFRLAPIFVLYREKRVGFKQITANSVLKH